LAVDKLYAVCLSVAGCYRVSGIWLGKQMMLSALLGPFCLVTKRETEQVDISGYEPQKAILFPPQNLKLLQISATTVT